MMRSKVFKFLFAILLFFSTERFCRFQTGGFRLSKVTSNYEHPFVYQSKKSTDPLQQPFYYLGSGVQFYVFLGEDKETILKLFKHHHMGFSTDFMKKIFPKLWPKTLFSSRQKRMDSLFKSASIAYTELPEETGMIFLHLGKSKNCLGKGRIYDKIGIAHDVDFDQINFLLQKRAETVQEVLQHLFEQGKVEEALVRMKRLIEMIETCSKKEIKNKDGHILENCGFLGERPIQLDIGSFTHRLQFNNPDSHSKAGMRARLELLGWIKQNYPERLPYCKQELFHEKIF